MQYYLTDARGALTSGPYQIADTRNGLPSGAVVTDQTPPEPLSGEVIVHIGGGRWASVPEPAWPAKKHKRNKLDQGEFRLLFTFAERQAEVAYKRAAEAAAQAGTANANHLVYLTMRDDFDQEGEINLDDPATSAALDFYVAFELLTAERKAQVLTGERPA